MGGTDSPSHARIYLDDCIKSNPEELMDLEYKGERIFEIMVKYPTEFPHLKPLSFVERIERLANKASEPKKWQDLVNCHLRFVKSYQERYSFFGWINYNGPLVSYLIENMSEKNYLRHYLIKSFYDVDAKEKLLERLNLFHKTAAIEIANELELTIENEMFNPIWPYVKALFMQEDL